MKVTQVIPRVTEQYPWTHRVGFDDNEKMYSVYVWTHNEGIDGLWVAGAFYTTEKVVTMIVLRWSHL